MTTSKQTNIEVKTMNTQGTNTMISNDDIISQFLSGNTSLPTEVTQAFAASFEAAKDANNVKQAKLAEKALGVIVTQQMIKTLGGKDTWLGSLIYFALVEHTSYWKNIPKTNDVSDKTTHGMRIRNALEVVIGSGNPLLSKFDKALDFLRQYEVHTDEDGNKQLVKITYVKNKRQVEVIQDIPYSPVKISIVTTGIKVSVKYKSVITPKKGQEFIFSRNVQQTFGTNIINEYLEGVLSSLRIHNEYEALLDSKTSDRTVTLYRDYAYKFNKEDALVLLLLLKENNLDVKELFKIQREGGKKLLVLSRKEGDKGVKSLNRVLVPTHTFPSKYGMFGVTSTNDAKMGFVEPMVSIPRMVEFNEINGNQVVFLRESANKMMSRIDKLNNSKAIWTRTIKLFVVADATKHPLLNKALAGGNILTPDYIIESDGGCRVVNEMDLGGVKASYTPFEGLDRSLRKGDTCVIGVNGFKGGLLSALGLLKGNKEFVKDLSHMLDANTLMNVDKLPETVVETMQHRSTTVMNYIYNEVTSNLTSMEIAGEEVEGIACTVEVKITNPYTLDMLQFTNEEDEDVTEGAKALEETKEKIENVVEELESGIRPSSGIRAFVAKMKAESADDFSVYEWVREGLENGTLKRKGLSTKVISQEIQSVAHWYGDKVAQEFVDELLEQQMKSGFNANKIYAYQLLGFYEREVLNTIRSEELVGILMRSNKGIVEDSPVYFKDTMQEILDLISVYEDFGWLSVEFANGTVEIPLGSVFLGDTLSQMDDESVPYVIAKGLLADLLEVIKTSVDTEGDSYPNSQHHLIMETFVQKPLLGKNFGYQFVKGYYGVALPLIGNYGITTIAITNRDRMVDSDDKWVQMTFSKSPQYFKGMTATYNVMEYHLGKVLDLMLECAIFVNVEVFLSQINDFDGDLGRLTKGKSLPFVTLNYNEFNGNFFKQAYEEELGGNKLKAKKAQQCSLAEFHKATYDAVTAKNNVGSYTANSYFYEAMTPNLVGTSFLDTKGLNIDVTEDMTYKLNALLKMLIQVEAMDNMKQEGSHTFITEMLLNHKLRGLNEQRIDSHLASVKKSLVTLALKYDMDLDTKEISDLVELAYTTAYRYTKDLTTTFNLYSASNVNIKALSNVMTHITEGEELDTIYNFKDCYEAIINGVDTKSMYYQLIMKTGEALEKSNFKIRA